MTETQKRLNHSLYELIKEKFGSVSKFCKLYYYNEQGMYRFLSGKTKAWDERRYEAIRDQAHAAVVDVDNEMQTLKAVIKQHWTSYAKFCEYAKVSEEKFERLTAAADWEDPELYRLGFLAYRKAVHASEKVKPYVNRQSPVKYLTIEGRRKQSLARLGRL